MPASTQQFLEIEDIRNDVVILKNKSLRGIILVSSTNFALKSREEQEATILQFQNFLNSLDFPIQIVIQSRRINLTAYLRILKELELDWRRKGNELMAHQTKEHRNFLETYISQNPIMTKNFFIVVPYFLESLPGLETDKKKLDKEKLFQEKFEVARTQLLHRLETIIMGLKGCGLEATILNQKELIELFWIYFHPKEAEVGYLPEIPSELLREHGGI